MRESLVTPADPIQRFLNELANGEVDSWYYPFGIAIFKRSYNSFEYLGKANSYTLEEIEKHIRKAAPVANDTAEV